MNKDLNDMTLEELWELFPIILTPCRPYWQQWAREEMETLSGILADYSPVMNHIGSTAIPGIWAKPIIDIMVEIPPDCHWPDIRVAMESSGYRCMSIADNRVSFNKGYTPKGFAEKVFHIHIRHCGDHDEICFRDYLRNHPDVAHEYEALKLSLLPKYRHNRDGYTEAKSGFIKRVTALAKRQGRSAASDAP